ncbi:MAG TPA: hypothetical protein VH744_13590, partial [Terriglobales bacterium]
AWAQSPQVRAPATIRAGETLTVGTGGSGSATLYVIAPGHVAKRQVRLGEDVQIGSEDTQSAGTYLILACDGSNCGNARVNVIANQPNDIAFLVHPSRIRVQQTNAISAVAVVLDRYQNLVLEPNTVKFQATMKGGPSAVLPQQTHNGIAWARLNSGAKEGKVEIAASVGEASERRIVQQVASEPCNLRASVQSAGGKLVLQTDPIRDCRGNALPDGTIVTFTKLDKLGRSTVDAPIKKGIARTQMAYAGPATISVACGVSLGNEIRVGGPQ